MIALLFTYACYNRDGSNSSNRKANGKKWLYGWC